MRFTEAEAREKGFTQRVHIAGGFESGDFLIKPGTDLDGWFLAYALDWDPEFCKVNGSNCTVDLDPLPVPIPPVRNDN